MERETNEGKRKNGDLQCAPHGGKKKKKGTLFPAKNGKTGGGGGESILFFHYEKKRGKEKKRGGRGGEPVVQVKGGSKKNTVRLARVKFFFLAGERGRHSQGAGKKEKPGPKNPKPGGGAGFFVLQLARESGEQKKLL